ncbi:MAG: hypothetical protein AAGK47_07050 [Bacteroidota bacterium]
MKIIPYFFALFSLLGMASCDIINPEEQIPSYIIVEPITLTTDIGEGTSSAKITEAWVFVDADFVGAYSLPATIPVLYEGTHTLRIQAGIHDNGINSVPEIYPFYETFEATVELSPDTETVIAPTIGYLPDTEFAYIEDFESGEHLFMDDRDFDADTKIDITTDDVFEGRQGGKIVLTPDNPFIDVATNLDRLFSGLQEDQVYVYVEVNYKSDVPVLWGVIGYDDNLLSTPVPTYDPGFNAKDEWNKIYFNFSSILFNADFAGYQFGLTAVLPSENGAFTTDRAEILLDNIKIVHF